MILLIVFCVLTILIELYGGFLEYQSSKDTLSEDKYEKINAVRIVLLALFSIAGVITFFMNYKLMTIIIVSSTIVINLIIEVTLKDLELLWSSYNYTEKAYNCITILIIGTIACLALIGLYYLFNSPDSLSEYEIKEVTKSEQIAIITEKRVIEFKDYGVKTPSECYFAVLNDAPRTIGNKQYIFYSTSTKEGINESVEKVLLYPDKIKINYIPEGETPYYVITNYKYEYVSSKDSMFKRHKEKKVYEVYIPEKDVLSFSAATE